MSCRPEIVVALLSLAVACGDDDRSDAGSPDAATADGGPRPTGWRVLPEPPWEHGVSAPALLPDGRIVVVGGDRGGSFSDEIEAFDPATLTWSSGELTGPEAANHTATVLDTGEVLVVGSALSVDTDPARSPRPASLINTVYRVGADLTATEITPTNTVRAFHAAVRLPDGEVLVAGGATRESDTGPALATATAERFDPATSTWRNTPPMAQARLMHTATLLPSGEVLVAGGKDVDDTFHASAEIYDPSTDAWRAAAPMATARAAHAAVRLGSGRVLVAGGMVAGGATADAEVYDPAVDRWDPVPAMGREAAFPAGTHLPSGDALVAGGALSDLFTSHGQALIFEDGTGSWVAMEDLPGGTLGPITYEGRKAAGMVLLPDGHVVIVGGLGSGTTVSASATLMSDGPFP